jgi:hypothetical protein
MLELTWSSFEGAVDNNYAYYSSNFQAQTLQRDRETKMRASGYGS